MQLEREMFNQPVFFSTQFQSVECFEDFIFSELAGCFVTAQVKPLDRSLEGGGLVIPNSMCRV